MQSQTTQPSSRPVDEATIRTGSGFDQKDAYNTYLKSGGKLSQAKFSKFIKSLNVLIVQNTLERRRTEIPKFGTLAIYRATNADGTPRMAVNKKESKDKKKLVRNLNMHSEGRVFVYSFTPAKTIQRRYGFQWFFRTAQMAKDMLYNYVNAGNIDFPFDPNKRLLSKEELELIIKKKMERRKQNSR